MKRQRVWASQSYQDSLGSLRSLSFRHSIETKNKFGSLKFGQQEADGLHSSKPMIFFMWKNVSEGRAKRPETRAKTNESYSQSLKSNRVCLLHFENSWTVDYILLSIFPVFEWGCL